MSNQQSDSFNLNLLQDMPADEASGPPSASEDEAGKGAAFAAQLAGGGDSEFVIPTQKRQVSAGAITFVGLAVVAAGVVWWMYQRTGGPATAAAAADPTVEQARVSIQQFLNNGEESVDEIEELLSDSQRIMDGFLSYSQEKQIPLDELKTNPFYHESLEEEEPESDVALSQMQQEEMARREAERRRQEQARAEAEAAKLDLETILYGKSPRALINGKVCRVGQVIGEFTIEAIRPNEIEVRSGDHSFTIPHKP